MSWDINRVILVGRLASDVELKYTPSNVAVAKFRIAVGGKQKNDGNDNVSFFSVVVWNKQAETCSKFLTKGKQVAIDGRLEQRSWVGQDGVKKSIVEIVAERIEFLGASGGQSPRQDNSTTSQATSNASDFYDNSDFDFSAVDPSEDDDFGGPNF
ncbi:MAG: single-stranded DNA-binding protein [Brevinematales bacterium]|nr:single-stranded DNA-binding protein [Brevinematales bacterium]